MSFVNYQIESIFNISFEEFFHLIDSNREYIKKGFPRTVKRCETKKSATELYSEWTFEEKEKRHFCFFIRETNTGSLIGLVNIKSINANIQKCEIGYFISQEFSGKGIISKVVSKTLSFCFDTLDMNKVFICVSDKNIGSQKVALKNGFVQEGVLRQEYKVINGTLEDIVYFGLLREEYFKS
ncbi:GNAT family N-acetyltransferase [Urechidicola croceus]|uniref:N-acetyltransferase domain-containing protein n=1 Tax=Urechidicola croceus TaxID=1850246 RepID=A0A1D8P6Q8_9FLAO|nr:GNAT family protein [Urechidicola croceus]AOW20259.1 hypothetical protein LPB138_06020 [Urechidicola croceus]